MKVDSIEEDKPQALASMQKIVLNHVQTVALAAAFPLRPEAARYMFDTFGVFTSVGDVAFNPECSNLQLAASSRFFQKQILSSHCHHLLMSLTQCFCCKIAVRKCVLADIFIRRGALCGGEEGIAEKEKKKMRIKAERLRDRRRTSLRLLRERGEESQRKDKIDKTEA